MKLINEVSIWNNGINKQATILTSYVVNLILNESATFYYGILAKNLDGSVGEILTQGNLSMSGLDYKDWVIDNDAWDYIAKSLNLTIIGDYQAPIIESTELS